MITGSKDTFNRYIKKLNNEIERVAQKYLMDSIDTHTLFLKDDTSSLYDSDGLHLSKEGYNHWITEGLLPYIKKQTFQNIGMIGDSITAGVEQFSWGKNSFFNWKRSITKVSNWQELLQTPTSNYGINGNTSQQLLERLDKILAQNHDLYFLLIGVNDILQGTPLATTIKNIEEIILRIEREGVPVVVQLVFPVV